MFEKVVDQLMVTWYSLYEKNKELMIEDEDFEKSKQRKEMNQYIEAIVILYKNKDGRS